MKTEQTGYHDKCMLYSRWINSLRFWTKLLEKMPNSLSCQKCWDMETCRQLIFNKLKNLLKQKI